MRIPVDEPPVGCQATSMAFRLLEVVGLHTLILAHRVTLLVQSRFSADFFGNLTNAG